MNNILDLAKKFKQDIADISSEHIVVEINIRELPKQTVVKELPDEAMFKEKCFVGDYYQKMHIETDLQITLNSIHE